MNSLKDRGLVLRVIPYSDSSRIYQCFSLRNGLISLIARTTKSKGALILQTGSFIEFSIKQKPNTSLHTLNDVRWDPSVPTDSPSGQESALWVFTIELLQKSLKEQLPHPNLFHRISAFYAYLTQENFTLDPLVALVIVSYDLGVCDTQMVLKMADKEVVKYLALLGISQEFVKEAHEPVDSKAAFNVELERFQQHFNITQIESLYLLDY